VAKFTVYYSISDSFDGTVLGMTGKHFALYDRNESDNIPNIHYELSRMSDKVWQEWDDGEIRILKTRHTNLYGPVDLKEFAWVKLSSKSIYG
jgi:hypothetical protein